MNFKKRTGLALQVYGDAPLRNVDTSRHRIYHEGETVVLLPEPPGRWRSLRAEVVEVNDERLRVRAPDDHFSSEGECLLKRGEEFEAARDEVETVNID